jgi:hypothetical protein
LIVKHKLIGKLVFLIEIKSMPKDLAKNVTPKEGPKGDIGPQGPPGEGFSSSDIGVGPQGEQGPKGDTGFIEDIANDANDRVITAVGDGTVNAESNLTFDGSILTVTGDIAIDGTLDLGGTEVTSTAIELNKLDASSAPSVTATLDGASDFLMRSGGVTQMIGIFSVQQYMENYMTQLQALTSLTVDNIVIDGSNIGVILDTDLLTLTSGVLTVAGEVSATTLDIGGTNITSTATELNVVDGDTTATPIVLADADRVVVNDAGTMKQVALSAFETYFETALDTLGNVTSLGTLTGLTVSADATINSLTVGLGSGDIHNNTVFGYRSLYSNTIGNYNVATGYSALYSNEEGNGNVATGYLALYSNITGNYNVATGYQALYTSTGHWNVATGYQSLYNNIGGSYNSGLGHMAGFNGTTGSNNTYLGYDAQPSSITVSNEIVLGDTYVTAVRTDGTIYVAGLDIGGTTVTSTATELNVVDGDNLATSTTLADADRVVVNDDGTMKQVALTDFETYFETALDTLGNVTSIGTLTSLDVSGDVTLTSATDVTLKIVADTDNSGEDDNPLIWLMQDGGGINNYLGINGSAGQNFNNSLGNGGYWEASGNISLQMVTNNEARITILGDGTVGIATHTPTSTLHVVGDLQTDNININGNTISSTDTDGDINLSPNGTGRVNFADAPVIRPKLKDYSETVKVHGTKNSSFDVDFEEGNVHSFQVGATLTVTVLNPPATGIAGAMTLIITNGASSTLTWDPQIDWPGGNAPALSSSGTDVISLLTVDAGTIIYGFVGGINFS